MDYYTVVKNNGSLFETIPWAEKSGPQSWTQYDAIFMMKTSYVDRKRTMKLLTEMLTTVTSVWGPEWLLLSSGCLLAFFEVAIINISSRFALEKANVICMLFYQWLLWLWVWDSTLLLMLPRNSSLGSAWLAKIPGNKPKCSLRRSAQEQAGRGAKFFIQSLSQPCPWKNKEATLSERKDLALWWKKVDPRSSVGCWGPADTGREWGWALLSHHLEAIPWIITFFLATNNRRFLHPM